MRWYRNLYLGPRAAQDIQKIRGKAAMGKLMAGIYYVSLSDNPHHLLDIFHNGMLSQPLFGRNQCTDIVGVAEGKMEALRLVQTIVEEIYGETGGLNVQSYFKEQDFVKD